MDLNRGLALWSGLLLLSLAWPAAAHNGKTAYAIPLSGITIDGKLDDWPQEMAVYPIEWVSSVYKPTPPEGPEDLTASFRVGYDVEANLLYLAIVVRDEELIVHPNSPSYMHQDLCEVYVDGDHSGEDTSGLFYGLGRREAQQYAMVAGPGKFSPDVEGNPALVGGDTRASGIRAAVLRLGNLTVYEWAIPIFASFPDRRLQIQPGETIGFDVVVVDADGLDAGNWIAWTPEVNKVRDSSRMGNLALVTEYPGLGANLERVVPQDYSATGVLTGRIAHREDGAPFRWAQVEIWQGDRPVGASQTDETGTYHQCLHPGSYTVKTSPRGVREEAVAQDVEITSGGVATVDFFLEDLGTCFHVDDDAPDRGDGSAAHPFPTIQLALDATSEGDTVRVAAGVYREPVELVRGVALLGAGMDATFLDGEDKHGVLRIFMTSDVVVEGFAIAAGRGMETASAAPSERSFGGVLVADSRHVRISHNLISGNSSVYAGSGITCINADSTVVLAHNLIVDNATERPAQGGAPGGGGIYLGGSQAIVHHNTIAYNQAVGEGGGILCESASPALRDNIIVCNIHGGMAHRPGSSLKVESGPLLLHNDVWHNALYDYSGLQPGAGDFAADPEFRTPEEGDFHLSRLSSCRDAGTSGDVGAEVVPKGALQAAVPPRKLVEQFRGAPPEGPVVRQVNFLSLTLPSPRKLSIDTVQVEVHPLDLERLPHTEKVFDHANGLPSDQVTAVAPAPDGSIWVGTDRGTARYDGLWTYLDSLDGLPSNEVTDILPTREGTVWIATKYGLAKYRDGRLQTVSNELFDALIEDPDQGVWLQGEQAAYLDTIWSYLTFADSSGRLYDAFPRTTEKTRAVWWWLNTPGGASPVAARYTWSGLEAYALPPLDLTIPSWRGYQSLQVADGGLWIGFHESRQTEMNWYRLTARSIGYLNSNTAQMRLFQLPEEWVPEDIHTLLQVPEGPLWVFGSGIILQFDGLRWSGAKRVAFASPTVELDQEGNLWFGGLGKGAIRYGPPTWTTFSGAARLEGEKVSCIAEDQDQNLWFGSEKGLSRYNQDGSWTQLAVTDTLVTDLLVDRKGQVWVATALGVHRYDGHGWIRYTSQDGLADTVATALAEGADGRIWVGTGKGLFWFDGQGWRHMPVSQWRLRSFSDPNAILHLHADPEGKLWIGTQSGIYVYEQGEVRDYFEVFYPNRDVDLDHLLGLENQNEIRSGLERVLKDEAALAWFLVKGDAKRGQSVDPAWRRLNGVYGQLLGEEPAFRVLERRTVEGGYVDLSSQSSPYVPNLEPEWQALAMLGSQPVSSIFADADNALWFASFAGLFKRERDAWVYYAWSKMPFAGGFNRAATDRRGNLWLATNKGVVYYNGRNWIGLDAEDGLADNQVLDVHEDHQGYLWFATAKGITRYRPDARPPQTRVVRGPEGTVGYGTSMLTFEFEGGDWEWEQRGLTFSYALLKEDRKPEEGDWSEWGAQKFVQVPSPGDGHFIFHVRARDKTLNVDPTPAVHPVYIAPPLWKVLWFQTSVSFGLLVVIFSSTYAIRRRRERDRALEEFAREQQQRLLAQEKLNRELEKELQTAHEMQMALMPKEPPRIAGFEITGRCMPANHVGGDLFQYFYQHDRLSISLADVTGHAMEAAIPVVMFSGVLDAQMEMGGSVEELFSRLNRSLHRTLTGRTFVCFALGELDLSTHVLRLSNSGCPYPYHFRTTTGEVAELQVDAYPLGVRSDTSYRTIEVLLSPGDRVVFCSDGIIEAANAAGEMFGFERTAETIRRGCAEDLSAEGLLERIMGEVKGYRGEAPQGDDQTVVVLRVDDRGSSEPAFHQVL